MRLAILSDIHGNPLALDAVLADIQSLGEVDAYWLLGDFAALGYDPVTPLEKVTALPHASFTRGNTDRYVVAGDLPVQRRGYWKIRLYYHRSSRQCAASPVS
jgi:predicted phosphodiesterase